MEQVILAGFAGTVAGFAAATGDLVEAEDPLLYLTPGVVDADADGAAEAGSPEEIRPDLAELLGRRRRSREELLAASPADGLVAGTAAINAETAAPERARALVLAYDWTVFAGTQGVLSHRKTERLFDSVGGDRLLQALLADLLAHRQNIGRGVQEGRPSRPPRRLPGAAPSPPSRV